MAEQNHDGDTTGGADRYVVRRVVEATAHQVFTLLSDPTRHQDTEPTDWVGDALDTDPLTHVGQVFGIEMFHVNAGGRYEMHNRVIALEPDRTLAWEPGQYGSDGTLETGGWTWRYDLAPDGDGTEVTLTYDWSGTPEHLRQQLGLPPFEPEFLERSLGCLETGLGTRE